MHRQKSLYKGIQRMRMIGKYLCFNTFNVFVSHTHAVKA